MLFSNTVLKVILLLSFSVFWWFFRNRSRINYDRNYDYLYIGGNARLMETNEIPKIIHQTYHSKSKIPEKVQRNFEEFAPGYERRVYDDKDIQLFLSENFHSSVLEKFNAIKVGAHKADLFRYCIIYVHGGIYMDVKTELVRPISELFPNNFTTSVIGRNNNEIYQGIIASTAKSPIFLTLIAGILNSGLSPPYNLFIKDFMRYIRKDALESPKEGLIMGKKQNYNLFTEKCTKNSKSCEDGLDRYGLCCQVLKNNERIIKTRYADYPW